MTQPLGAALGLTGGEKLAVVGCGGKTTVVNTLAGEYRAQKVLVMPTTRIRPMAADAALTRVRLAACRAHVPAAGVQCYGQLTENGKLAALPAAAWPELAQGYDLVLMEADGSRGLPCKGWAQYEPVVPDFTTHTLGVVTTRALGRPADEATVHRLPEFFALTGLAPGDTIGLPALAAMVCAPGGMFKGSRGRRVLLVNRVEDEAALKDAEALAAHVTKGCPQQVEAIWAGSARQNRWRRLV